MNDSHANKKVPRARTARVRSGSKARPFTFRVTAGEKAAIEAAAAHEGVSVGEYVRSVLLSDDHASVQATLTGLVASIHTVCVYVDELIVHMEKGNFPDLPEARGALAENRKAITELLRLVDGGSH